ncbi:MAG: CehA/McbA family metallohydrolase [Christensenellales bacterium]
MNKYFPYELHCHTTASDGSMSAEKLISAAKERGFTGIAVTDHNTYSALDEAEAIANKAGFVLLKGIEWTTFWGHLTVFGGEAFDWRALTSHNIDEALGRAKRQGALINIAHPFRLGEPVCSGCRLEYPINDYENIAGYEIMSGPYPYMQIYNRNAIAAYDNLLKKGYRLAALYGYDWHSRDSEVCYAATYLPAQNPADALAAIKAQDTFVSVGLNLSLMIDGTQTPFGSTIMGGEHIVKITVWADNPALRDKFGLVPKEISLKGNAREYTVCADCGIIKAEMEEGYFRVEVRGDIADCADALMLSSSPVYVKGGR